MNIADGFADLLDNGLILTAGHHDNGTYACVMGVIGWLTDGEWTDKPSCVHPVLSRHVQRLNDRKDATHDTRKAIVEQCADLLAGTADWGALQACWVVAHSGSFAEGLASALVASVSADLWSADLRGADLRGADLQYAYMRDADLRDADLRGADLRDADLWGADLWGADLRGADLRGADLRDAALRGADMRSARYTQHTLWPAKFDPMAAGAITVQR